jgi:hypothetical protein
MVGPPPPAGARSWASVTCSVEALDRRSARQHNMIKFSFLIMIFLLLRLLVIISANIALVKVPTFARFFEMNSV